MWHKPCRTFNPWCLCIKTRCLSLHAHCHGWVLEVVSCCMIIFEIVSGICLTYYLVVDLWDSHKWCVMERKPCTLNMLPTCKKLILKTTSVTSSSFCVGANGLIFFDSLSPERCGNNFKSIIIKLIIQNKRPVGLSSFVNCPWIVVASFLT